MRDFKDKTVVITGAGSGIGRALAVELAGKGAKLALSDVDSVGLAETVARCDKKGVKALGYDLDVADRAAVEAHADKVVSEFGGANVIVNNAGVSLAATVEDMTWEDFDWLFNIDFWGVAHGTKAFLPHLIASGDGHVVNVSSVFGLMGIPSQSAYNAAKFAVRGFTESLRQEMLIAGHKVGVTCVHPGGIKTNIVTNGRGAGATPEEIAEAGRQFQKIAFTRPEGAAKAILRGVRWNRPRVLIGPDARVFDGIPRLVGPRYEDVVGHLGRITGAANRMP
ncbi:MAG TPA: SDR family NAD(P)-dependent oxidoreductase [Gordonia sp. (in: high G+C Gram-positive bacteria)]|uniref:SDR family NAD(P)-dependent oxidoreductase n=1 Tax=unclassified Gordonia (in: high G+C Gram-positive bacteria) TaxID=2657482 RepID=UPI000FB23C75|nr:MULTISPECIES: SDR family NAD(P)-dependent oxidoreductase [unclassified Gordonia (in: high G+C Gram-positive bacteria)]RUP41270.1 MAG: SDR family NAD(P)-dependent oxidoreductase [Gordonia sp. (in: high G+C Gram-positive bacteria)]HNP55523.1 SDR family NAD(P)-dependent oxidoreductase [Gordonia sp. (in: high G+C Gram-positive bacteria)]HRC51342.1 SDR family NAD(P)-dependent oxidoreductase [Gordonia sp. (in: high G+C Gram-positive bacteria)]